MSKCVLSAVLPAVAVTLQLRIRSELLESRPGPGGAPQPPHRRLRELASPQQAIVPAGRQGEEDCSSRRGHVLLKYPPYVEAHCLSYPKVITAQESLPDGLTGRFPHYHSPKVSKVSDKTLLSGWALRSPCGPRPPEGSASAGAAFL